MDLLLKRALDWASTLHQGQVRKYPGAQVPYVSHLAGVATILSRHRFDSEVVAAGALHDTLEDCNVSVGELRNRFGSRVAELVHLASETNRSAPWEQRKTDFVLAFPSKPWEAQAIILADKIDNFWSIVLCSLDHGDPWSMFQRSRTEQWAHFERFASRVRDIQPSHPIIDEFARALEQVRSV